MCVIHNVEMETIEPVQKCVHTYSMDVCCFVE